jgi:hypothetical protein
MRSLVKFLLFFSAFPAVKSSTEPFEAPKYGVKTQIPLEWPIAVREEEDRVFVAVIPQADPDRPGVAACELGLAPENLDEYRTRIDRNAERGREPGKLVRNEIVRTPKGERLVTLKEFRPRGVLWRELKVRIIAHRQLYTFTLNTDEATYPRAKIAFDALIDATEFSPPNTGADRVDEARNRWAQREFKFALDLPPGWEPALAPSEIALFYANGPAQGIWADNVLVVARPHQNVDLERLAREFPDQLRREEEGCEVLSCQVVKQGDLRALETVVRTQRGPFSMTILERRFAGKRFDYELKYTVETKQFEVLEPMMKRTFNSFEELPGEVPVPARVPRA